MNENLTKNWLFEDIYNLDESLMQKEAIVFKKESYTFQELKDSVNLMAHDLHKLGVGKGDHVALLGLNSYNWVVALMAIVKVGGVAVLMNFILRHQNLVDGIKFSDCKFIVHGKYAAMAKDPEDFAKVLAETGIPEANTYSILDHELNFKTRLQSEKAGDFQSPYSREEDSKRTSYIVFTTGTTSEPKAVMLHQYGLMNHCKLNLAPVDKVTGQKAMVLLPLFHSFGLLVLFGFLAFQKVTYLNDMSDPVQLYKEFLRYKCSSYASVAIIFDKLAHAPGWFFHHARFVKHCIVGGGFTSKKEFKFLERKYGRDKFFNGYGQTECSPLISFIYPGTNLADQEGTVGKIIDGIELVFQNPATKQLADPLEGGEILIKGYCVCNGYYKLPKEKQPFDEDGWLHTGDLGKMTPKGYLTLTGRLKDIIIRKGENISPAEIEKAFEKYPEFPRVRVLGFPSLTDGEFIMACVELPKKPLHFHESYYIKDLKSVLPALKVPAHIIYMPSFPLNANGKLDERALREIAMDKLTRIVDQDLGKETRKLQKALAKEKK